MIFFYSRPHFAGTQIRLIAAPTSSDVIKVILIQVTLDFDNNMSVINDYVHISEGETEQGGQPQQPSPQLRSTVSVKFCGLYDVGL